MSNVYALDIAGLYWFYYAYRFHGTAQLQTTKRREAMNPLPTITSKQSPVRCRGRPTVSDCERFYGFMISTKFYWHKSNEYLSILLLYDDGESNVLV
jgi:hypothetical protein